MVQTCGRGLSVLGGGNGVAGGCEESAFAVWTEAFPLLAPLELLLVVLEGPIMLVLPSIVMLNCWCWCYVRPGSL